MAPPIFSVSAQFGSTSTVICCPAARLVRHSRVSIFSVWKVVGENDSKVVSIFCAAITAAIGSAKGEVQVGAVSVVVVGLVDPKSVRLPCTGLKLSQPVVSSRATARKNCKCLNLRCMCPRTFKMQKFSQDLSPCPVNYLGMATIRCLSHKYCRKYYVNFKRKKNGDVSICINTGTQIYGS